MVGYFYILDITTNYALFLMVMFYKETNDD